MLTPAGGTLDFGEPFSYQDLSQWHHSGKKYESNGTKIILTLEFRSFKCQISKIDITSPSFASLFFFAENNFVEKQKLSQRSRLILLLKVGIT